MPGRSGMVRRNDTMRSSRSSSRTMTEARMRGSILPPHRIRPTLRPAKRSGSASMAASPAAPAPSAMVFCKVRNAFTARSIMRLVDQDDVADQLAHHRQRQRADILDRDAFGERRAAERQVAAGGSRSTSTDRARIRRRRSRSTASCARAAMALPAISPPPPIGIDQHVEVRAPPPAFRARWCPARR